jgi:predicted TPR repeat methyltransferase
MSVRSLTEADSADHAVAALVPATGAETADHFEAMYRDARADGASVPWQDDRPHPAMVAWLNVEASALVRPGATAVVVGCGLGDDLAELCCRGYDVTGFDVSATAIEWAKERHPAHARQLVVADVLDVPPRMVHRFDLVIEVNTIQSLPPSLHRRAVAGVASLARPHGCVLAICRGRDEGDEVVGPPYALSPRELVAHFEASGMRPLRAMDDFIDDQDPPVRRLRGLFRH